jgi:hypothetical protein
MLDIENDINYFDDIKNDNVTENDSIKKLKFLKYSNKNFVDKNENNNSFCLSMDEIIELIN